MDAACVWIQILFWQLLHVVPLSTAPTFPIENAGSPERWQALCLSEECHLDGLRCPSVNLPFLKFVDLMYWQMMIGWIWCSSLKRCVGWLDAELNGKLDTPHISRTPNSNAATKPLVLIQLLDPTYQNNIQKDQFSNQHRTNFRILGILRFRPF